MAARTRLCLHLEWRPGDTVSATDWQPAMEKLWSHPTLRERLWLNRGDTGFGQEAVMAWHEQAGETRPQYLFKLRLTSNVRRAIAKVPWPLWEGVPTLGDASDPVRALAAFGKPVIAAVNGAAVTGGFELALACDVLLASTEARFADTHARIGVIPGWGLSQKLSRLIGLYPDGNEEGHADHGAVGERHASPALPVF